MKGFVTIIIIGSMIVAGIFINNKLSVSELSKTKKELANAISNESVSRQKLITAQSELRHKYSKINALNKVISDLEKENERVKGKIRTIEIRLVNANAMISRLRKKNKRIATKGVVRYKSKKSTTIRINKGTINSRKIERLKVEIERIRKTIKKEEKEYDYYKNGFCSNKNKRYKAMKLKKWKIKINSLYVKINKKREEIKKLQD